jgi:hypothetical protein
MPRRLPDYSIVSSVSEAQKLDIDMDSYYFIQRVLLLIKPCLFFYCCIFDTSQVFMILLRELSHPCPGHCFLHHSLFDIPSFYNPLHIPQLKMFSFKNVP